MNKEAAATLINYNFWANGQILAAAARIPGNAFVHPVEPNPGWGSLRGILVHALDAEYGWRTTLQSLPDDGVMDEASFATVPALQERWNVEKAAWLAYLAELDDARLQGGYGPEPAASRPVWQIITHVLFHSAQHRSEAAAILTGLGQSPGELDFGTYLAQQPG